MSKYAYKVHKYEYTMWNDWPEPIDVLWCGRQYGESSPKWSKVTCKICLKIKARLLTKRDKILQYRMLGSPRYN